MKRGTKSILFGAHQFLLHPLILAIAWWKLYGFPSDFRLWVCFFVHDLGYWGLDFMDDEIGEKHPEFGANLMHKWFDHRPHCGCNHGNNDDLWGKGTSRSCCYWYRFTLYHSRFYCAKNSVKYSPLCVADKLSIAIAPTAIYVLATIFTGEIFEYMQPTNTKHLGPCAWFNDLKKFMVGWVSEHKNGGDDHQSSERRIYFGTED